MTYHDFFNFEPQEIEKNRFSYVFQNFFQFLW
jgi:hypothetical protein